MGYEGGELTDFPRAMREPTRHAARSMARDGAHALAGYVRANTPVDSGDLRESWREQPIVLLKDEHGRTVYETGVWTDVWYAEYVERGTGLYGPYHQRIFPKKPGGVLSWIGPDGERVFAKSTKGMQGAHMVAFGVAKTEAEFEAIVADAMADWRVQCERAITARGRR